MRFLSVLRLARVDARLIRDRIGAVEGYGLGAGRVDRLLRERNRVGAHIGDVAVLIECLGGAHGVLGREPEFPAGLLLQGRGRERDGGAAGARLRLDVADGHCGAGRAQFGCHRAGRVLIQNGGLRGQAAVIGEVATAGNPVAAEPDKGCRECLAALGHQLRLEIPVARRDERRAFQLPLDDQPHGGGLHATGRPGGLADLAPQHRRHLESEDPIHDPPGLLRIDERRVEVTGVGLGRFDGVLGDLVEDHALHGNLRLQDLQQVPGDGLTLAILIRGQDEFIGVLQSALELGDCLGLALRDRIVRLEVVVDIDREPADGALLLEFRRKLLGVDEVTDVTDRGPHVIVIAEILGDGPGLGR